MKLTSLENKNILKIIFIFIILIVPWSLADYTDDITPEKITSDLRFYQINTCEISFFEFLLNNFNVVYQDHYKIRFNDYSSIKCFGQITGIDQIGYVFYISIGTNTLVNLILQSSFWLLIFSFIKREKNYTIEIKKLLSIFLGCLLFCIIIYSEQRFYSEKIFLLDLTTYRAYIYIFFYLLYIGFFSKIILETRRKEIIYLLPFIYILVGLYSGFNIYFLSIFFVISGIEKILDLPINKLLFSPVHLLILFWGYNATGEYHYLDPDKIRGLSNTVYNFLSTVSWAYFTMFLVIGITYFFIERMIGFNLKNFGEYFLISSTGIVVLGYLGSSIPFVNFFNYYLFGLTKFGTDNQEMFGFNYWGEKVAWRGFFPSAETIGEFFALSLLIFFLLKLDNYQMSKAAYFYLPMSLIGLYTSNNRAATIALLLCLLLKLNNKFKFSKTYKTLFVLAFIVVIVAFIGFGNLNYSLSFTSNNMIKAGFDYSLDSNQSSAIRYIDNLSSNSLSSLLLLLIGQIAFLVNRAELWGLFLSRYNPNILEFLFGTGPFGLSDHYSEINILTIRIGTGQDLGFLLTHSSILLVMVFFGIIGLILILALVALLLKKLKHIDYDGYLITIFIILNLFKSDSILYLPSLLVYWGFISIYMKKVGLIKHTND